VAGPNIRAMNSLLGKTFLAAVVRSLRERSSGTRQSCLVCGGRIEPREDRVWVRGDLHVHRRCATYSMRRRRTGVGRLGYPRV
jgi:hypothetical protein